MLCFVAVRRWLTIIGLALIALMVATCTAPGGPTSSTIAVEDVWARPAKASDALEAEGGRGGNSAVFLRIVNGMGHGDRLLAASAEVAAAVELHETVMQGDVMKMQQVKQGIVIPPGDQIELKPGGYHIMLIGLERDLEVGDQFPITLQFEDSGLITSQAVVKEP